VRKMPVALTVFLCISLLGLLMSAHATEPTYLTIVVDMSFYFTSIEIDDMEMKASGGGDGTYSVSGDFSDSGVVTETFSAEVNLADGSGEGWGVKYLESDLGTLTLSFEGRISATATPGISEVNGEWTIIKGSGTGIYAGLKGEGTFLTQLDFNTMTLHGTYSGLKD